MTMKIRNQLIALLLSVGTVAITAFGQSDQLSGLLKTLSGTPSDAATREQIIKLAGEMKPPPAIPEEARQNFVEAAAIAKTAKDTAGQKLAIASYEKALLIAPWWGDAYYNLAVTQELVGEFDKAQSSLKFYILTQPGEKEAREAQDKIYAIGGKKKVAEIEAQAQAAKAQAAYNAPEAVAQRQRDREMNELARFDGAKFIFNNVKNGSGSMVDVFFEVRGKSLFVAEVLRQASDWDRQHNSHQFQYRSFPQTQWIYQGGLRWQTTRENACFGSDASNNSCKASTVEINSDGTTLTMTFFHYNTKTEVSRVYRRTYSY